MTNYRHNWREGYHPFLAVPGGSAIRPWGMDVPALGPVQGGGSWAPCQTQVIEWPWAADELGVPFDQDNLWGVRTRCWSTDVDTSAGDRDWWVAVPKVLGEEYTPRGRSHVQPMIFDHLGDNPLLGVVEYDGFSYNTRPVRWRTPTGQYPSDLGDDGYLWLPMNLNQNVYADYNDLVGGPFLTFGFSEADNSGTASGMGGPGCSIPITVGPSLTRTWGYVQIGRHVGFRGGGLRIVNYANDPCGPVVAGNLRIVIGWDDSTPSTTALPPNIIYDDSFAFSDLSAVGGEPWPWELLVDLPAILVDSSEGEAKQWVVWAGTCMAGSGPNVLQRVYLSPRTDIPLWYWASQRNRVATGGIIV